MQCRALGRHGAAALALLAQYKYEDRDNKTASQNWFVTGGEAAGATLLAGRDGDFAALNETDVRARFGEDGARAHARGGKGPVFLLANTYRLVGHYIGDPQVYRDKEELQETRETELRAKAQELKDLQTKISDGRLSLAQDKLADLSDGAAPLLLFLALRHTTIDAEDRRRALQAVVVVATLILACTSLPKEIDNRVIYTIVTKPATPPYSSTTIAHCVCCS